ncbi:helix-turn-helix domain-containing protein [Azospirillum sp.]|uniref:TetR/AcrR family transcriptional regulator n=1 Tax=Azospirillum sp. TaxID=34012 RepID=UPI002D2D2CBF|nr:helix-turn-helix domain-containing protein [Azospirillum sp.]HYF89667.1 helix-turn-helix domain-containing protein [Azospirillum sp.]
MPRYADTRGRIIQAASKLFYAEGIGRVSVDAVAEKAGITKRTLYYHSITISRARMNSSPPISTRATSPT